MHQTLTAMNVYDLVEEILKKRIGKTQVMFSLRPKRPISQKKPFSLEGVPFDVESQ